MSQSLMKQFQNNYKRLRWIVIHEATHLSLITTHTYIFCADFI